MTLRARRGFEKKAKWSAPEQRLIPVKTEPHSDEEQVQQEPEEPGSYPEPEAEEESQPEARSSQEVTQEWCMRTWWVKGDCWKKCRHPRCQEWAHPDPKPEWAGYCCGKCGWRTKTYGDKVKLMCGTSCTRHFGN